MRVKWVTAAVMLLALCATPMAAGKTNFALRALAPPNVGVPGDITTQATGPDGAPVNFNVTYDDPDGDPIDSSGCDHASGATFPVGTTSVTCSATDSNGETGSAAFSITVDEPPPPPDTTSPTITTPGNLTAEATGPGGASVSFGVSVSDDTDPSPSLSCDHSSGTYPLGTTTVSCNASDASGNQSSASFTITVRDTTAPSISVPSGITVAASGSGATVNYSASASDAVDPSPDFNCSPPSGTTFGVGTSTVTCTARDNSGNQSSKSFNVTVQDQTPPTINVPSDINTSATGPGGAAVSFTVTASDAVDANPSINCNHGSGSTFPIGTTTVTCTATDDSSNSSSDSFHVTVTDTTDPVLTVPGPITVEATSGSGAVVSFSATATDNVDTTPTVNCSPGSGSTFGLGTTTVSCTASDDSGNVSNAKTFTVKVQDTTAPTISVPGDITVAATGATAFVSFSVTAHDAVDGSPAITCSKNPAGATYQFGTTHVTCTAKDDTGNTSGVAGFDVIVQDLTAPSISVPANITKEATTGGGAAVTFTVTASDAIDSTPTINCDHTSGSTFPVGTTHVSCTATDNSGNTSAAATFDVTVRDTTAPTLNLSGPSAPVAAAGPSGANVSYSVSATDLVDPSPAISCSKGSGTLFPIGNTTVSCTATDSSNNSSGAKTITIRVTDQTPPTVASHAAISVEATSGSGAPISFVVTASDTIDPSPVVTCNPPSGSTFAVGTTHVSCTAKDGSGNTSAAMTFDVNVLDTTPPTLSLVPADVTEEANGPSGSKVIFTPPTAVDIVDGPIPSVPCSPVSGSTFPLGTTTVTCSAADRKGNSASATFKVTIVDTTPPTLIPPGDTSVYATSDCCTDAADPGPKAFVNGFHVDDIADPHPLVTADNPQSFGVGTTVVHYTATDASGNKSFGLARLTVLPKPAPGTTPPPLPPPKDNKPPANVTQVTAKAGDGQITMQWKNPPDADFDHVEITRTVGTGASVTRTVVYQGKAAKYTDKGLKNDVQVRYVISSVDKNGNHSAGIAVVGSPKRAFLRKPADGASLKKIPAQFVWLPDSRATYYNLQLYLGGTLVLQSTTATPRKVLSVFPTKPVYNFKSPWKWEGKSYKMTKGTYTWYVWPGYGAREDVKYGSLLGAATFKLTVTPKPAKPAKKPKPKK